ncbi:hypothetical protein CAEBREN_12887 [Caenorhabditis brenneri]|uniref:Uncharacterized protein n=1 Tax=Caenorhabditis brenneri TaxID=135651 RepID=G0PNF6_CAEBE|nr:hypothetical protein CAEBREN_12887 [Caenorhabditis brenneri]
MSSPSTQVSLMRAAELAQDCDVRKSAVIIRNTDLSSDQSVLEEFGAKIAAECQVTGKCSVFRIPLKNDLPPLIKVQLPHKQDATKVLKTFESIKGRLNGCRNASVRPDLSKPELAKYRDAWKRAIQLNNEKKQRLYTVRNLEVVKVSYPAGQSPDPWIVKQNK